MNDACDNFSNVHDPVTIGEGDSATRVYCRQCYHQYVIRKDANTGAPEKKEYARIFKRDTLQGNTNLFYKIYPQYLKI